jgi:hypothetical protein
LAYRHSLTKTRRKKPALIVRASSFLEADHRLRLDDDPQDQGEAAGGSTHVVAQRSQELLRRYQRGETLGDCPIRKALAGGK